MGHAKQSIARRPLGDYVQSAYLESNEIQSRTLWRLPELCHSLYPGIKEGFVIHKENSVTLERDKQYFITNRPANEWGSSAVLKRILLHWDTETGVFGVKDNTFQEDKVRYASLPGAMSHVALLNATWNCLSAAAFNGYWEGESMNCRIQFWKDNPDYNPFC